MEDVYKAKSFTEEDKDLGFLAMKVGGREFLHTLQGTLGLPFASVIQRDWQVCFECVQSFVLDTM